MSERERAEVDLLETIGIIRTACFQCKGTIIRYVKLNKDIDTVAKAKSEPLICAQCGAVNNHLRDTMVWN